MHFIFNKSTKSMPPCRRPFHVDLRSFWWRGPDYVWPIRYLFCPRHSQVSFCVILVWNSFYSFFFYKVNLIWLLSMTDLIYVLALGLLTLLYLTSSSLYILLLSAEFQKDKMISLRHKEHFPLGEDLAVLLIPWFSLFMAITL